MVILTLIAGLALLFVGAEILVKGASRLATAMGMSPLLVGLTVVAYGTSAPELAVSIDAALAGRGHLALGNVVGSNIMNVLLVLGICATIGPIVVARRIIRADVPFMAALSVLLFIICLDGNVAQWQAILLFVAAVVYTVLLVWWERKQGKRDRGVQSEKPAARSFRYHAMSVFLTAAGLILLPIGADMIVASAVTLGTAWGMSEVLIGLTIVAVGTSLPEIATTVVASMKKEREMALGNIIGSNVFNILLVVGASGAIVSDGLPVPPSLIRFDLPVMVAVALAVLPVCFTYRRIERWEGILFLGYYGAYVLYLILDAGGHDALPAFSMVMSLFVLPLTALTLLVLAFRYARRRFSRKMALQRESESSEGGTPP